MNAEWHTGSPTTEAAILWGGSSWWFQHCKYSKVKINMCLKWINKKKSLKVNIFNVWYIVYVQVFFMWLWRLDSSYFSWCATSMCTLSQNLTSFFHMRSVWAVTSPIGLSNIPLKLFKIWQEVVRLPKMLNYEKTCEQMDNLGLSNLSEPVNNYSNYTFDGYWPEYKWVCEG